jgi:glyoxylase-like metal-dependent hydrolase (beta-lactamase superfamily II)
VPVAPLDLLHLGHERVIGCYLLETDDGPALLDCGPASCFATLAARLDEHGLEVSHLRHLLLSHIHLDHAGATGVLVREHPGLQVHVSEIGAPHLVDPSRLERSARRLYGEDFDRLWGELAPVPEANVHTVGARVLGFECFPSPGHASHHVCYLHEPTDTAFVGDVGGVRIEGGPIIPPTPPPDIDLDLWHESLRTVAAWDPARLAITHFGTYEDVEHHIATMHAELDRWGALARETDTDSYAEAMIAEMRRAPDATATEAFLQAMPPDMLWPGLDRYWSKRKR